MTSAILFPLLLSLIMLVLSIMLIVAVLGTHASAKDLVIQAKKANVYLEALNRHSQEGGE